MALIIEDGTGKADAQSYVSESDLVIYAAARGVTLTSSTVSAREAILVQGVDYVESKSFIGDKRTQAQSLQWPRYNVVIDDFTVDSDVIPQLLIDALCEVAISIDGGTNPLANLGRETIMEKVDVLEVEYSKSAHAQTYLTAAETKLSKLVKNMSNRAIRG